MLLCMSMVLPMAACKNKEASGDDIQRSNVIETDDKTGEQYYLIGDFENYFECTQVKYEASFGTVTEVKKAENADMVTYGEQVLSLKFLGQRIHGRRESRHFVLQIIQSFLTLQQIFQI